jgi:translation initiation factor 6 (eIF-6)
MKTGIIVLMSLISISTYSQGLIGTWQMTEEKTCFTTQFEKSDTEKELEQSMSKGSKAAVAKIIKFDKKGTGTEGIFSTGKKKGTGMTSFKYSVKDRELQLLDAKSGIITQRFIIDEVTESSLKIHDAAKDCEVKIFSRVK